jgi:hypothetical protein
MSAMRRIRALLLGLAALLVAAPPAAAGEHLIDPGPAYAISTYRGWLLWTEYDSNGEYAVLRRTSPSRFNPPRAAGTATYGARLGSDSRGRTAVVYQRCTAPGRFGLTNDCELVRHTLSTGAERTILRTA